MFGIFNGVASIKADVMDGIILSLTLDAGRTVTSTAALFERVADLSGDRAADDLAFERLAASEALAPEGSVPEALRAHLVREIGPEQFAAGGDWLLRMPIARSWSA